MKQQKRPLLLESGIDGSWFSLSDGSTLRIRMDDNTVEWYNTDADFGPR